VRRGVIYLIYYEDAPKLWGFFFQIFFSAKKKFKGKKAILGKTWKGLIFTKAKYF